MLRLCGQLRGRRRRTHHSDNPNAAGSSASGSIMSSSSTDHDHHDELRVASSSWRKRKQVSCSSGVALGDGAADVSRSREGVVCVDETGNDVGRVDREVDRVGAEGGDVSRADTEVEYGVSRVGREVDYVDEERDDVSRCCKEADNAEEGDDVEGLIDEEIVKVETTSFCGGASDDKGEGKALEVAKNRMDVPPDDDCCPICFGSFIVPCRGPCGHWYCGGCILQYWNYTAALQPCSCPMCSQKITKLTPEAALSQQQDAAVTEVLRNVWKYNRLFIGGPYGIILKMFELPLYIKRMFTEMMNPDRPGAHLNKFRIFAMTLGFFYSISPLDFLRLGPTGSRTQVAGFKVQSANHYTIEPLVPFVNQVVMETHSSLQSLFLSLYLQFKCLSCIDRKVQMDIEDYDHNETLRSLCRSS